MKSYIVIIIILIFVFAIKDFQIELFTISCNRDTDYFSIDFVDVQAGDWCGSLLYLEYHCGGFEWDFLFLNSKISKIKG